MNLHLKHLVDIQMQPLYGLGQDHFSFLCFHFPVCKMKDAALFFQRNFRNCNKEQ